MDCPSKVKKKVKSQYRDYSTRKYDECACAKL